MIPFITIAKTLLAACLTMGGQPGQATKVLERIDLGTVYEHPADMVQEELCFYVQLDALLDDWNAFGTAMAPQTHLRANVWGDSQRLWDQDDYYAPLGEIYVRQGSSGARRLLNAERYQRFLCIGRVRNLRCGKPWIEVTRMYKARRSVPEGSLLHVIRAAQLQARKAYPMARDEYNRALTATLPSAVRADLLSFIEACHKPSSDDKK